jgi:sugar O-acyltransferase (sialic acid O-acetyltransferase NeuD family)
VSLKELVLIGAGGHAKSCIDVIESQRKFRISAIIGLEEEIGKKVCGYEVIGTDDMLPELAKTYQHALVAIGQISSPKIRRELFEKARNLGFVMPTIIASSAFVSVHARIQSGSVIMHGAVVNAGVQIGTNCIVNSKALIEHDSQVGNHCHISTGALVNGNVLIGEGCFIGSGSVIREGISIGSYSLVGMSNSVTSNLASKTVFLRGTRD